jgi:hypothetical protein
LFAADVDAHLGWAIERHHRFDRVTPASSAIVEGILMIRFFSSHEGYDKIDAEIV